MFASSAISPLNRPAPDFQLTDHTVKTYTLQSLMGPRGLVLGFLGDIWRPVSVHRIFGLQRCAAKLAKMGWQSAIIVRDQTETLRNFHASSPLPIPFTLMADAEGKAHEAYTIERPCLLLVNRQGLVCAKWQLPPNVVLPDSATIFATIQRVGAD